MNNERRYPVGIQTFSEIIRGGYVYVDKTDLVWNLTRLSKYIFLSRPRRFGKSLLSSTLHSYFAGQKHLFEGLKIMQLEQEGAEYPVIHLDLSIAKSQLSAAALQARIMLMLDEYAQKYGEDPKEVTPGAMVQGLIRRAYQQTGKQVAVIIDEYDAPLLEVLHEEENLPHFRKVMQEFYVPLKAMDPYIKFCFITGITKFSQLSIFSTINNLKNISMRSDFSALCGITEKEVKTVFAEDIRLIGEKHGITAEEVFLKIKDMYDGYHFAAVSEDIYNPFSLLNSLSDGELTSGWFASATPSYLIRQMQHFRTNITVMDNLEEPSDSFDIPTEAMTTALPLLYQSGYLTIKGYDRDLQTYTLSIPNQEVRIGFTKGLMPTYIGLETGNVQIGFAAKFWRALRKDDLDLALQEMQAFLAGISLTPTPSPKERGMYTQAADNVGIDGNNSPLLGRGVGGEALYLIFNMLNVYVRTQVKCAGGRIDMVVLMPDTTYVLELKTNESAQKALDQINQKGYATPYQADGRRMVKAGIHFNTDTRTIDDWVIE